MKLDIPPPPFPNNHELFTALTTRIKNEYQLTRKSEGYAHRIELVTTCDNCSIQHGLWGGSYPQSGCQGWDEGSSEDSTRYWLSNRIISNKSNHWAECCTAPLQANSSCHSACQYHLLSRTYGTSSTGGQCHHSIYISTQYHTGNVSHVCMCTQVCI